METSLILLLCKVGVTRLNSELHALYERWLGGMETALTWWLESDLVLVLDLSYSG